MAATHPEAPLPFVYRISGGDEALIVSKELPEDDPKAGAADAAAALGDVERCVVVGISCGLSAPYVAGLLDYAMRRPGCTPVLVGFNPVSLARDAPIEGWDRTCHDVFASLAADPGCFVLNPIVGPEALTGSSRMKGGSMTQVLLEATFRAALAADDAVAPLLEAFEAAYRDAYSDCEGVAELTALAGAALRGGGNLYYVGSGSAALVALMDASEMVDTYGCRLDEVRTFVEGGWGIFDNAEGSLAAQGGLFVLSTAHFAEAVLPGLTAQDAVIFVNASEELHPLVERIRSGPASAGVLAVLGQGEVAHHAATATVRVSPPEVGRAATPLVDFATKLVLNAVSTGANVLKGAVYGNSMINLTVSNNKLFHRSAEIVAMITGAVTAEQAGDCLLRAIHGIDAIDADTRAMPLSAHIEKATPLPNIVPTAALLATGHFTVATARAALARKGTSLRETIAAACG